MFTLQKDEIRAFVRKCFNTLNGVVNPNVRINNIVEDNTIQFAACMVRYEGDYNEIKFNVNIIQSVIYKYQSQMGKYNSILHTILHELYHANQEIDQSKYDANSQYREFIEFICNAYAARFMDNYRDWIKLKLGVDVNDKDFLDQYAVHIYVLKMMESAYIASGTISWPMYISVLKG